MKTKYIIIQDEDRKQPCKCNYYLSQTEGMEKMQNRSEYLEEYETGQEEPEIYGGFATVYDLFMDDIPYDEWFGYLQGLFAEYGITEGLVAELACGTGEMTKRFAGAGYEMIGLDLSEEMLGMARQKCPEDVLLIHQDMKKFELYGPVRAMFCVCDGMNYICNKEDLRKVFRRVSLFLEDNGIFIFDLKTDYFYREILGSRTLADNRENAGYIWENIYHEEEKLNEYLLTVYEAVEEGSDLFVRTDELHRQRAYEMEEVRECLEKEGLFCLEIYEALTKNVPDEKSERVYFIVQKRGKE